jgi:putative proteasome-type protease
LRRPRLTYCLALNLEEGLVFMADTRTSAGVDNVSSYRKLHVLRPAPDLAQRHREALQAVGAVGTATFILGGQIAGNPPAC